MQREVTSCRTVNEVQTRITGYRVTYEYRGQQLHHHDAREPGPPPAGPRVGRPGGAVVRSLRLLAIRIQLPPIMKRLVTSLCAALLLAAAPAWADVGRDDGGGGGAARERRARAVGGTSRARRAARSGA